MTHTPPQLIAFDVFGTLVDWHGSVSQAVQEVLPQVNADDFARQWRAGYAPAMARARQEGGRYRTVDSLHRQILDALLLQHGIHLGEADAFQLNRVWHRLRPWSDVVSGLARLRSGFITCTLSNGDTGLLARLTKYAGLPLDCIVSAELYRSYKPDPEVYLGLAATFGLRPAEVMLVAAHESDLDAARRCGLRTAYIERPEEFGIGVPKAMERCPDDEYHVRSVNELADALGCP